MKKLFILALFLLSANVMFGQFSFGLKLGANFSKLTSDLDSIVPSSKAGFQVGAFVRFGKKFYVQPEVYYTLAGGTLKGDSSNWEQAITVGSVDVPLLVGFKLLNAKVVNLRILAGPMVSFVTNTHIKNVSDLDGPIEAADLNNVNWAIQAGAGIDVLFLTLDLRYQWGLNNVIKTVSNSTAEINSKQNTWVISLGFKI